MKFSTKATTYIFPLSEVSSFFLLLHDHLKEKSNLLYPYTLTQLYTTTTTTTTTNNNNNNAGVPFFYKISFCSRFRIQLFNLGSKCSSQFHLFIPKCLPH
jgi:hypothetical protein